jgi:hypothetical protein
MRLQSPTVLAQLPQSRQTVKKRKIFQASILLVSGHSTQAIGLRGELNTRLQRLLAET